MQFILFLRRVFYWIATGLIYLFSIVNLIFLVIAGFYNYSGSLEFLKDMAVNGVRGALDNPFFIYITVAGFVAFWTFLYLMAVTKMEKSLMKYTIPLSVFATMFTVIVAIAFVMSLMAGQGAGQ